MRVGCWIDQTLAGGVMRYFSIALVCSFIWCLETIDCLLVNFSCFIDNKEGVLEEIIDIIRVLL